MYDPVEYLRQLVSHSGKLALINRMLPELKKRGHKILLFSQMTRMLDILQDYSEISGYKCLRIDGTTKQADRQEMIKKIFRRKQRILHFPS